MTTIQPAGNFYDKYNTRNPIAKWLMDGFLSSFDQLVTRTGQPSSMLEVGCGEGELSMRVARATKAQIRAFDVAPEAIDEAKRRATANGLSQRIDFGIDSVYAFDSSDNAADLVVCCEVLEHLEEPQTAVEKLSSACKGHLIASVPREPIWRVLNIARGKYLGALGNTPGHVQHWSSSAFRELLETRFEIIELLKPMPWSMALCRPRG